MKYNQRETIKETDNYVSGKYSTDKENKKKKPFYNMFAKSLEAELEYYWKWMQKDLKEGKIKLTKQQ